MSQELGTTESNARSSIYLKTERLPSFLVGSCSCVEQKVCWRSDLGWLCLGVQRNLFWVLCFRTSGQESVKKEWPRAMSVVRYGIFAAL